MKLSKLQLVRTRFNFRTTSINIVVDVAVVVIVVILACSNRLVRPSVPIDMGEKFGEKSGSLVLSRTWISLSGTHLKLY